MTSFLATIFLIIIATIERGYLFKLSWNWFVSPTFNVNSISTIVAIGICMGIEAAAGSFSRTDDKDLEELIPSYCLWIFFAYPVFGLMMYIFHCLN